MAYGEWASTILAACQAHERGVTPDVARIQHLFNQMEKCRERAQNEEGKLIRRLKLRGEDVRQLLQESRDTAKSEKWEPGGELRGEDKAQAVRLIRHLQTQIALQQLAMETYNDGLALAAATIERGDEVFNRPKGSFQNPSLVAKYALPASEEKVAIAEGMLSEHQAFDVSGLPKQALEVYSLATELLTVITARARLQLTCLRDWVDNPSIEIYERMSALDGAEEATLVAAVSALNNLIESAGHYLS
jgi:hypothetical protein